jgi:hypothetical protein
MGRPASLVMGVVVHNRAAPVRAPARPDRWPLCGLVAAFALPHLPPALKMTGACGLRGGGSHARSSPAFRGARDSGAAVYPRSVAAFVVGFAFGYG